MKKILIVEDEPAYSRVLYDQLSTKGYTVMEAEDGEKGLAIAKKERPNLILLDLRMPKMDGMTMLHHLRKDTAGKKVKVIILTNLEPDDEIIGEAVHDQPAYYFVKSDTHLHNLLDKVKEILEEGVEA